MKKRKVIDLQLHSIQNETEIVDPTKLKCKFIIMDFEVSLNNAFISKETALSGLHESFKNMPIVAKYIETTDYENQDDHLEGHNATLGVNRYGEEVVKLDTIPIGVFTDDAYVETITDNEGNEREVLMGDAILWYSRFTDICDLLIEWNQRGININTSCELLYENFIVKDGVQEILSPIYAEGHCVLNSENRGSKDVVLPAYEHSKLVEFNEQAVTKFNKLVAEAINKDLMKEDKKLKYEIKFELSHNDIRAKIHTIAKEKFGGNGKWLWVADVYENYFILNIETETEDSYTNKYYKVTYVKDENDNVSIGEELVEVFSTRNWEEVVSTETQEQLNQLEETVKAKETELETLNTQLSELTTSKEEITRQFNEATEKLTSLNEVVDGLKEYKEKYETEQFEQKLSEQKEVYKAKFEVLDALDKFETEEVQSLLSESIQENTSEKALFELNSMLVGLVKPINKQLNSIDEGIKEPAKPIGKLMETKDDFDSRYGL